MMLRGLAVATVLITGAALNYIYINNQATEVGEPPFGVVNSGPAGNGLSPVPPPQPQQSVGLGDKISAVSAVSAATPVTARQVTPSPQPQAYQTVVRIKSGDTLGKALRRAGAKPQEAEAAIRALKGLYDPRKLKAGQSINLSFMPAVRPAITDRFQGFEIPLDYATRVAVSPASDGGFRATEIQNQLNNQRARAQGVIDWSLFKAGSDAGVPVSVMSELVRAFSWDVDFQRDVRKNDRFEVMYERKTDTDGNIVYNGKIVFAALTLSGQRKPIYLYTRKDGRTEYFDDRGQSAKKALMRTPIDGARLSSAFGKRKDPILGYSKMHTGTDFAAPAGTPIYAAGDGRVVMAGVNGSFGNYVKIRHNGEYSTAYAHMQGIKRGITKGKRVKQGQVIGFAGSSGRSTGSHLHYEIIKRGVKVNALKVRMPSGKMLKGEDLVRFNAARDALKGQWAALDAPSQQVAQR